MLTPRSNAPRRNAPSRRAAAVVAGVSMSVLLAACGGGSTTPTAQQQGNKNSSSPAAKKSGERVTINWFIGLGTGADQGQPAQQKKIVDAFNASQDEINLKMIVVNNKVAATTLATQVSGGNAPDIVGPVGVKGAGQFEGQWLDLEPLMKSQNFDTSIYDPEQVKAARDRKGVQTALPFGVYPSFLWYNKDLFDEAGLPYPPAKFGEKYEDGREWNFDTMRDVAKKLTVDANGNDATSAEFDPAKVEQWGYTPQFAETGPQYTGAIFGPGSFVAKDGKTAQVPEPYLASWKWHHDLIWKDYASPNKKQLDSDTLNKGNGFATGKIGMAITHSWYMCCAKTSDDKPQTFWDIAAIPSYKGKITAKLHQDTFRILKSTKHPEESFKVLSHFLTDAAPELLKIYNAMPANQALQDDYFASLDEVWTQQPNWQVAKDALNYPDIPNHESWTPNFNKVNDRLTTLGTKFTSDRNLDVEAEAKKFEADLQKLYAAAK